MDVYYSIELMCYNLTVVLEIKGQVCSYLKCLEEYLLHTILHWCWFSFLLFLVVIIAIFIINYF